MEFLNELLGFIGRWHPLFVHLPIGMLVVGFMMACVARFEKNKQLVPAIPFVLLTGSIAAVFAGVTGYLLSLNGGYEQETLDYHQWLGIAVAVISLLTFTLYNEKIQNRFVLKIRNYKFIVFVVVMLLLGFTGHYGGTLTHGKGYLKEALPTVIKNAVGMQSEIETLPLLADAQEAEVYEGIIQPILAQRCQSCHGDKKQEGDFALHDMPSLLKGGKEGLALKAGDLDNSPLYARLILPEGHEGRMPPKGRTPITNDQIKLIGWWISTGANFESKARELEQSDEIAAILKRLEEGGSEEAQSEYANLPEAAKLPEDLIDALQAKGIKVLPIADGNSYVAINTVNYPDFSDADMKDLLKFKDNIVQLKIGNSALSDEGLKDIATFSNLLKLHIEHTKITDAGLAHLKGHQKLNYINLFGVGVSDQGIRSLADIPSLKHIYTYQTNVTAEGVQYVREKLAESNVDTGKYLLPFLETDTIKF
ncbi:hypothetical protein ORI89_03020 [Sphingobacterium sp. UT-1RO-CII-1]|uniref:c-type cytochrome domain-containing protein n=1 Tax=Sphingobacterium sp. UT-1RO-CII-1 TaxID=2995225 RepID=UPI00227C6419|nr:c-type cytochrome domain-containing protein [Sphingobacterium sp. UT-1RO-CII-1]MCY4778608.1 hypothetical protein [Sphingobacterium sp. UT-1RO-CII-1]